MTEKTENFHSNPWDFSNAEERMFSHDRQNRIEYGDLIEFSMGSPLAGVCYWIDSNNGKHLIGDQCGGPPIWNITGDKVAVPLWKWTLLKGTIQKLVIVDIIKNEWTLYKRVFRVLDLRSFENNLIGGYDSPIYNTVSLQFDLNGEEIEKRKQI